jgi:YspA, cpYpsA-related SLOG family
MRVIVAGSRGIEDPKLVADAIKESGFDITELVSGACSRGMDALGEKWAFLNGIPIKRFAADWGNQKLGKRAGHVRNREMAKYGEALAAVWDKKSPGTLNMIHEARLAGIKVFVKFSEE